MVDPLGLCGEDANDQGDFWSNFTIHGWLNVGGFGFCIFGGPGPALGRPKKNAEIKEYRILEI